MNFARSLLMCSLLAALAAVIGCSRSSNCDSTTPEASPPASDRPTLNRDEPLPTIARDLLGQHMMEHGDGMENLLWSALMLDHEMTAAVVDQILTQPRLSRPSSGSDDTINNSLPDQFFDLQDQLYEAAEQLKAAATQRDDIGTAKAYARLAETCVTCHSVYLQLPFEASRE